MASQVGQRRLALFVFFFLTGLALSSWVTRTPAIRDGLGASIAEMGLIIFGLSLGSMVGILLAGGAVSRFGTKTMGLIGMMLISSSLFFVAIGVVSSLAAIVSSGLFLFGIGAGLSEIAINMEGADVEAVMRQPVLHALHGCFSLGTVVGASIGIVLTAIDFPVAWHMALVSLICFPLVFYFITKLSPDLGRHAPSAGAPGAGKTAGAALYRDKTVLFIGLIVLGMAFAEGAANDWLPLLMVDEHGLDPAQGTLVYLGFALAMTAGRFGGGVPLRKWGRKAVMRGSAIAGAIGLALVIFVDNPWVAGLAVILWGIGASLGFPVALSAAGDSGENADARVKIVAIVGYVAFLVGPPMLGFLGDTLGLRSAMLVVLAFVLLAAVLSSALDGQKRPAVAATP
ncbi:Inner membrane protein YbjJ [Pleomorphomonas sp. T1.2MG-36]|uniref:MFS transporter n=1 Tax=Pleomorphomonas sp. T1.2MG-36 TaxID=3041167 RepID=UPI00247765F5|nr:MFS transporter [Pleomorphomonas sp. T1.2MG-36]CAI9416688.1 Inner membrane protein YbjJ [Pleomorphomonas sp. T1.2MG-36]